MIHFHIQIGQAYFNNGFINIPLEHQHHFGNEGELLTVYLGAWDQNMINNAWIDRHNMPNGVPRIHMGVLFTNWIQAEYQIGQELMITLDEVNFPNAILIS